MAGKIDLNGAWRMSWFDGERGDNVARAVKPGVDRIHWLDAQVPGEVHLDLMRAGLIEDPSAGLGCLADRWVEEQLWLFARTFSAPALEAGERVWLVLEALDLAAAIYVNGQLVARHANAFYPCRVEVSGLLAAGENYLVVVLDGGLFHAAERPATGYAMTLGASLHKRNWLRQVQSSFGWDWSTRLINVGIRGSVYLEVAQNMRFDRLVVLAQLEDDLKHGLVTARVFVEGLNEQPLPATVTVEVAGLAAPRAREVAVQPGLQCIELRVPVEDPSLWWPVGHGSQPLYSVRATLTAGGEVLASATRRAGFRHVEVDQSPHPQGGRYFIFRINGKPIFVKGGNFVPADMITARLDRARYATLVARALEAHCNMLRVWGGGLYESDDLYDLCDEAGVLLWQEFIFACAKYPTTDEAFLADVKREATHQVRRLAHHPSLIAWCGNNEQEEGAHHWGYEQGVAFPDYALYHLVLPIILKNEDGTRYYQPSSPYSPDQELPRRDDMGDQHPWTVGFANTDFRDYRRMNPRFPNEGGILGPTALPTMLACLPPGQRYPHSFAWDVHDNGIASQGDYVYPDAMLEQWLGRTIESMSIEDYTYWGGVLQGEGLVEYIRNFRRRMFDTSSAIFWMYNDCWPATRSWTVVDYYLRRTPAFYPVRRAFQPTTVALAVESNRVPVYGVNDGPEWQGELRCGMFALTGGYPLDIHQRVSLPANASTLLADFPQTEWSRLGERTHGAFALLLQDGHSVAQDCLFLPLYQDMLWPKADVTVTVRDGAAVFECEVFAWRVCLDLDGEQSLPDNFFDLLPGIPTILAWPSSLENPRVLRLGNGEGAANR